MKLDVAWAEELARNSVLKILFGAMTLISIVLGVGLVQAATREPLVVERSCMTSLANVASADHSEEEIEAFVTRAVKERFDHRMELAAPLFAGSIVAQHGTELEQYKRRGMRQTVVINQIAINGAEVTVDADRILSVGDVRVALRFGMKIKVSKVPRSSLNPWGLIIQNIQIVKDKKNEKAK